MKSYSSREVIKIITDDGWYEVDCTGSHHQYKHPTKKGRVTVIHPTADYHPRTLRSILKQAQINIIRSR